MKRIFTDLWWLLVYAFVGMLVVLGLSAWLMTLGNLTLSLHLVQWTQTVLLMMVPALAWVRWRKKERVVETLRLRWPGWEPMLWALAVMTVSMPLASWLEEGGKMVCEQLLPDAVNAWAQQTMEEQLAVVGMLLTVDGVGGWLELIMLMCVGTAIGEEMMFRGAVLRCFVDNGETTRGRWIWAAVWVGLIFSVCHGDLYGLLPRWVLGTAFVWMVYQSRSIWPGVLAHAFNNTWALVEMKEEPAWLAWLDNGWVVMASVVLTALTAYGWMKRTTR